MRAGNRRRLADKILTLEELAKRVAEAKQRGKKVVLCHGVFDLLHFGHVKHFEEAKTQGDLLVVTLTPDHYVNKGVNRPAFTENLRAQMLAAVEMIDYVALNRWPTAVEMLALVAPDVYAKGPDYRSHEADVTRKITEEAAAIEKAGGRIYYTEEITFSSSTLINRYMSSFPKEVDEYLANLRLEFGAHDVHAALDKLRKLRVLVVGEAIVDEYVYVEQMGKSAKDPVLAMRYVSQEQFAGGSLAIANHAAALVDEVHLTTFLGTRDSREAFVRDRLAPNVKPTFFYKAESSTIVKRRYVESYLLSKLFEVYVFNDELLTAGDDERFATELDRMAGDYDLVIVADYGHGILTHGAIDALEKNAKFLAVNTQQNAANVGLHTISRYSRADFLCTNEGELRADARTRVGPLEPLIVALSNRLQVQNTLVTRGKSGTVFYRASEGWCRGPAFARSAVDRVGAGDAVLSWTALMAAAGLPGSMITFVSNVVGALASQIVGNRQAVDRVATFKFIDSLLK